MPIVYKLRNTEAPWGNSSSRPDFLPQFLLQIQSFKQMPYVSGHQVTASFVAPAILTPQQWIVLWKINSNSLYIYLY